MALINGIEHKYSCTIHGVTLHINQAHLTQLIDGVKDGSLRIETADDTGVAAIVALDQSVLATPITGLRLEKDNSNTAYTCSDSYIISDITLSLNSFESSSELQTWHLTLEKAT